MHTNSSQAHSRPTLLAQALTESLQRGSVVGARHLVRRAQRTFVGEGPVPDELEFAKALAHALAAGGIKCKRRQGTVVLHLRRRHDRSIYKVAAVAASIGLHACATSPRMLPAKPISPAPVSASVQQVFDAAGRPVYEPCWPCAVPTAKTPVLDGSAVVDQPRATAVSMPLPPQTRAPGAAEPGRGAYALGASKSASPHAPGRGVDIDVQFGYASSALSREAKQLLTALVAGRGGRGVRLIGSADASGSAAANEVLAKNRAAVVRAFLVSQGVPRSEINTEVCATCFVADNETESGRRSNRRVRVSLL